MQPKHGKSTKHQTITESGFKLKNLAFISLVLFYLIWMYHWGFGLLVICPFLWYKSIIIYVFLVYSQKEIFRYVIYAYNDMFVAALIVHFLCSKITFWVYCFVMISLAIWLNKKQKLLTLRCIKRFVSRIIIEVVRHQTRQMNFYRIYEILSDDNLSNNKTTETINILYIDLRSSVKCFKMITFQNQVSSAYLKINKKLNELIHFSWKSRTFIYISWFMENIMPGNVINAKRLYSLTAYVGWPVNSGN